MIRRGSRGRLDRWAGWPAVFGGLVVLMMRALTFGMACGATAAGLMLLAGAGGLVALAAYALTGALGLVAMAAHGAMGPVPQTITTRQ